MTNDIYTEEMPTASTTEPAGPSDPPRPVRTLRRSRTDRMIGGVCGGLADYLSVDASLVRVLLVAATVLGFGAGAVLYVACWLIVPEQD